MNTNLTAKNEDAVMALVNGDGKNEFNPLVAQYGKAKAIRMFAQKHKLAVSTVKAAAYYL